MKIPKHVANYAHKIKSIKEKIKFYHQTCGNSTKSTWLEAIKQGFFIIWTGLTYETVKKYLELSPATTKINMKKNLRIKDQYNIQPRKTLSICQNNL